MMTSRGRAAAVAAFIASAALCAGAAVALVKANDGDRKVSDTLPSSNPTLVFPSESPTPSPEPSVSASPTASPTPSATASTSPSASPATGGTTGGTTGGGTPATRRPTPSVTTVPDPDGLFVQATMADADGNGTTTGWVLRAHATDGRGTIQSATVTWGDGTSSNSSGRPCVDQGVDCRDFELTHLYPREAKGYVVTLVVRTSGNRSSKVTFAITVPDPDPGSPTPSPSASPSPSSSP